MNETNNNNEVYENQQGDDDDDVPPPLPNISNIVSYWWKVLRFPFIFTSVNIFVIIFLVVDNEDMIYEGYNYNDDDPLSSNNNNFNNFNKYDVMRSALLRRSSLTLSILSLIDVYILWRAIRYLEQQIIILTDLDATTATATETTTTTTSNNVTSSPPSATITSANESSNDHVELSKKIDAFLGHTPATTFVVNALYFILSIAITVSVISSIIVIFYSYNQKAAKCLTSNHQDKYNNDIRNRNQVMNFTNVPQELQTWAKSNEYYDQRRIEGSYTLLQDGSLWLIGTEPKNYTNNDNSSDDGINRYSHYQTHSPPKLLHFAPSTTAAVEVFSTCDGFDYRHQTGYIDIHDNKKKPIGFCHCCINRGRHHFETYPKIFCKYGNSKLSNATLFKPNQNYYNYYHGFEFLMIQWQDSIWIQLIAEGHGKYGYQRNKFILKVNPQTLNIAVIASDSPPLSNSSPIGMISADPNCTIGHLLGLFIPAVLILFALSYWLLRIRDVPVGIAPIVLTFVCVTHSSDNIFGYYTCLMVLVGAGSLLLVSKYHKNTILANYMTRDMMLWSFYTMAMSLFIYYILVDYEFPFLVTIITIVFAIVMDHPIFHLVGIGGFIGYLVVWVIGSFIYGNYYAMDNLILFPFVIVSSCGLVSAGGAFRRYRSYGIWCLRLSLQSCQHRLQQLLPSGSNHRHQRGSRSRSEDTESLLPRDGGGN